MYLRSMRRKAAEVSLTEALESDEEGGGFSLLDVLAQEDDLAERVGSAELCRRRTGRKTPKSSS